MVNTNVVNEAPVAVSNVFQPFAFKTFGEAASTPEELTSFIVEGLLPSGGLSILAGKPKSGKSTLSRQLAVAVVQGLPFIGMGDGARFCPVHRP
jgi:hypothetical protein